MKDNEENIIEILELSDQVSQLDNLHKNNNV